jgi:hypothetical protein
MYNLISLSLIVAKYHHAAEIGKDQSLLSHMVSYYAARHEIHRSCEQALYGYLPSVQGSRLGEFWPTM